MKNSSFCIRVSRPRDAEALSSFAHRLWEMEGRREGAFGESRQIAKQFFLALPNAPWRGQALVLINKGDVKGAVVLNWHERGAVVGMLFVERGCPPGAAVHLMWAAAEALRERGCVTVAISTNRYNRPARKTYRRLGFRPVEITGDNLWHLADVGEIEDGLRSLRCRTSCRGSAMSSAR